ncbi:MAG: DUF4445 domain-containing protein [Lachnospiraceae bacterium]|nr:DUF4445 domain-containing protein [Lachnospiraceae bacterium]
MTKNEINLYNDYRRKCDICTGCGRCTFAAEDVNVMMDMRLRKEAVELHYPEGEYLVTVDIGTTTIAMQLHGRNGKVEDSYARLNPQVKYGADVLSRIQAASEDDTAAEDMKTLVRGSLSEGLARFRRLLPRESRLCMVVAANTTMVYLLMGWDVQELGHAPFHVSYPGPIRLELDGVPAYIFPSLSAFVGGDITAGILACGMTERQEVTLLIDLGTNGEMVLGNCEKLIACSTAAGPAFEGGVNQGVWGADMVSILAKLRSADVVDETGLLQDSYFDRGVRIEGVHVTQQAIRALQMAKGAVMAGVRILADQYGISFEEIQQVILAGGFGYYLNPRDAAAIGLIPLSLADKTVTGGNTALTGAFYFGTEQFPSEAHKKPFWEKPDLQIEILNLAEVPKFDEWYLSSMDVRELCE